MVFVLHKNGKPLMPTNNAKARKLLKQGKAKVVTVKPFTIQLLYGTACYTQDITLGIDSGYLSIGFSAVSEKKELISGEAQLLQNVKERLYERSMYRRGRRGRLRYRKPRFDNRSTPKGWFAPSIRHKLDSHLRLIGKLSKILPVTHITVEVAAFDIQKIINPDIEGKRYQQGNQLGHWNVREYVLHRDSHKCQNPGCKNKDEKPVLRAHHLNSRINGATERPGDMVTLCSQCHVPENHKGFLKNWKPKVNNFKDATFMTAIRWLLVDRLKETYPSVNHTYGYITKNHRIGLKLEKSHVNDAFCIAGGRTQKRAEPINFTQARRNNRCLEKFYDAQYIDTRTGSKTAASNLNSGRATRNKDKSGENLRKYRGKKVSAGRRSIRKQRYFYQPNDLVKYGGAVYTVKGTQNLGKYVALKEIKKVPNVGLLKPYRFRKGFV